MNLDGHWRDHGMDESGGTRDLCLVGTIPEPIGGVAVHVSRLAALCSRSGYRTTIFDLHPGTSKAIPPGCSLKSGPTRWSAAAYYGLGLSFSKYDLVHVHVSRLRPFLLLHLRFAFGARFLEKFVATFHSGSMPEDIATLSPVEIKVLSRLLRFCGRVIAVNDQQIKCFRDTLNLPPEKLVVIPAYLPVDDTNERAVHTSGNRAADGRAEYRVIVASGYGVPLYGWHDLLEAAGKCPGTWQWIFCFYNSYDKGYYDNLRSVCAQMRNVSCYENLSPQGFYEILQRADTFVRPTRSDGDSIALREALALGLNCVASDVVQRPTGVRVYPVGSAQALKDALTELPGPYQAAPQEQFGKDILAIYDDVYSSNHSEKTKRETRVRTRAALFPD